MSGMNNYVEMPDCGGCFHKMIKDKSRAHIDLAEKLQDGDSWGRFLIPRAQLEQDRLVCTDNWVFAWKKICTVMDFQSERAEECLLDGFESVIKRAECSVKRVHSIMRKWPRKKDRNNTMMTCLTRVDDPWSDASLLFQDMEGRNEVVNSKMVMMMTPIVLAKFERNEVMSSKMVMTMIVDDATYWLDDVLTMGMGEHLGAMLFIRHMQVAQEELLKIFEGKEHLAYMILIFMFLVENPSVNIIPPKRL